MVTQRTERLLPPETGTRLRCVIDTDAANEIDDCFALAWALLEPERLDVIAVYAGPYSFAHRWHELKLAGALRAAPERASAFERELLAQHAGKLDRFERDRIDLDAIAGWPIFCTPRDGMQRSAVRIGEVFAQLGLDPRGRLFDGATEYLQDSVAPQRSAATDHLIATALATPPDGPPLYVLALGCPTNVACALLLAPAIASRIVVVWTSGYPSHAPHVNFSLNLEQDLAASRVLFDSGVPLVYLPGFHVGAQLRLSLPEVERWVRPCGAIGAWLHALYTHGNPLREWAAIDVRAPGFSWVIWDLICVAWLLMPDALPSTLVPTPALDDERRWTAREGPVNRNAADGDADRPLMREAHAVARDAVFGAFFAALAHAERQA